MDCRSLAIVVLLIASVGVSVSCGGAEFSGDSATKAQQGKEAQATGASTSTTLTWLWPCGAGNSQPKIEANKITLSGPGPHEVRKEGLENSPVTIKGNACNLSAKKRNVVFVIDVSGSMANGGLFGNAGNDPRVNGSCGRLTAVQQVISAIKKRNNAAFGIVTFEDGLIASSSQMFLKEKELYSDLLNTAGANEIADVLCRGGGATNYDAGLEGAQSLIAQLDAEEQLREVYFVSDGQPNNGQEGIALANQLKGEGVVIGTVMVGNENDRILKEEIASVDDLNAPLHSRVDSSSELAKVLAKLADNQVERATMKYSSETTAELGNLDFTGNITGTSFSFEGFKVNFTDAPMGIVLELTLRDRYGQEEVKSGELKWSSD